MYYSDETIEFNGDLWCRKTMEYYYDGHLYAHSAMETANSCGNCDGGKCGLCHEVWDVIVMRLPETEEEKKLCELTKRPVCNLRRFFNREQALAYFESV